MRNFVRNYVCNLPSPHGLSPVSGRRLAAICYNIAALHEGPRPQDQPQTEGQAKRGDGERGH